MTHTPQYERYIRSDDWALKRTECFCRAEFRCQKCGSNDQLEAHHLTYERLGHELPGDLMALCKPCHNKADRERAHRTWNARLNGWARKRYGPGWADTHDPVAVEEEFEDWLSWQFWREQGW